MEEPAFSFQIPRTSVSLIFLADEDEAPEIPIALVFEERAAEEIAEFIAEHYPQPEGTMVGVKLLTVHPDRLVEWANESS